MREWIAEAVKQAGGTVRIQEIQPVSGGEINEAYRVSTSKANYFVKINREMNGDFFKSEVDGLELLRSSETIAIPEVYHCGSVEGAAILVLEWIEGNSSDQTAEKLGQGVALLHQTHGKAFGLEEDNYLGTFWQPNGWHEDWASFYRDSRLAVQVDLAERKGRLNTTRRKRLEQLLFRIEEWIPSEVEPSLLHGDLWGGNWLAGPKGEPYLIDPAVSYGHLELELAFTELFGGFPSRFYEAYQEIQPLSREYKERQELYQLYYLLVHLNAFGESYGGAVDRILKKYVEARP
ncbi:MAG TPA: fructosamine kinase family protein [Bacillales bacterium]|nr:fructosamine kinase family protein [Bacillales bacterium]